MLLAQVEAPVVLEVAGCGDGAEFQDGLGAFEAPPRARYVHSVLTMCLHAPSMIPVAMGQALAQRGGVVQVALLVLQVAGALVGAGALGAGVTVGGGAAADPGRDLARFPVQDLAGLGRDPFLGGGLAFLEEGPGGLPCDNSSTWMKSITIVTVMPRRAASAVTASIWVLSRRSGPPIPGCGRGRGARPRQTRRR